MAQEELIFCQCILGALMRVIQASLREQRLHSLLDWELFVLDIFSKALFNSRRTEIRFGHTHTGCARQLRAMLIKVIVDRKNKPYSSHPRLDSMPWYQ